MVEFEELADDFAVPGATTRRIRRSQRSSPCRAPGPSSPGALKQAREQAVDFKGSKLISAVFEIYKTRSEQYLISRGRNWKALYKAYTEAAKARKAGATRPGAAQAR